MGKFKGKAKLKGTLRNSAGDKLISGTWTQSHISRVIRTNHEAAVSFIGCHCGTGEGVTIAKTGIGQVRYL